MTPQKITVKIPRKQGELIPFNLELWNTGEYEAIDKNYGLGRMLCIDNEGDFPIVLSIGGMIMKYTLRGQYAKGDILVVLFLRKKANKELPNDVFANIYPNFVGAIQGSLEKANENSADERLAVIHITYEWEDAV